MKILFATDGSKYSEIAARFLKTLHLTDNSEIFIVTVLEDFLPANYSDLYPNVMSVIDEVRVEAVNIGEKILERTGRFFNGSLKAKITKKTYVGHPAREIIAAAEEFNADLVVTGSAGRTGIEELLLGGVSQKVLKYSKKAVLITKKSFKKLNKILFATDGSADAQKALKWMVSHKLPPSTKVHVLSVVPRIENSILEESYVPREKIDLITKTHKEASSIVVENSERELKKYFSKVTTEVLEGEPSNEILIASKEGGYDLIVMGATGVSGIEGFLLGSVSRKVAKLSRPSVLVVK
ncbi:MAG: universal stress protein [Armatimonadota bacterium]